MRAIISSDSDASAGQALPDLLRARGLGFAVDGRVLWRNLEFSLAAGERLALTGPSGSGKTLLLRTLAGLVDPLEGELFYRGQSVQRWWMPAFRAEVMYLPQRPALPEGSVEAALSAPFSLRVHRGKHFSREATAGFLSRIGRSEAFLGQSCDALSGGEAQCVNVLRAVLLEPTVLLLDEPTASLDAEAAAQVEGLVDEWMAGAGRACIWTSHNREQLRRVTQRTLTLSDFS